MAKEYANHKSRIMHAALMGYYRFANEEQAKLQLQIIRDAYFISRHPTLMWQQFCRQSLLSSFWLM